ncbi:hypothetical protein [Candidatus Pyrohabitans sp.]
MEKKELIKNYLLEKGVSEEERKRRYEIAWDIWENFSDILFELERDFINALYKKILNSDEFSRYEISDPDELRNGYFPKKGDFYNISIYKKNWLQSMDENRGILNYSVGIYNDNYNYLLYYSIGKYNSEIPFSGVWSKEDSKEEIRKKLGTRSLDILNKIRENVRNIDRNADWQVDETDIIYKFCFNEEHRLGEGIIVKGGVEKAVNEIFNELVELKNYTEELIDEFIEMYKNRTE